MPVYPLVKPTTGDSRAGVVRETSIVGQMADKANNAYADVKADFGAVGDFFADDTTAIQDAIDAIEALGGGIVFFPPGTYKTSQLKIKTGVYLVGAGMYVTTLKAGTALTALVVNDSYNVGPTSWTTTETDYGVRDLTLDGNASAIPTFHYGLNFQRFERVEILRVRVLDTPGGSGIVAQQGTTLSIAFCETSGTEGNGIFTIDVQDQRVIGNNVRDSGDFGIEIGAGYDYGHAGGTAYGGDGVVIGNTVADCVNFGIACRGFQDGTANPNNHVVKNVVVAANTVRDSAILNEITYYELCENITEFANNASNAGVGVREVVRSTADLASTPFTSGATGAVTDITGLAVTTVFGLPERRAQITLRVRANSSLAGTNAIYIAITPAPLDGLALVSAVSVGTAGNDEAFVVSNDVMFAANESYEIKAQFFQGAAGTFTVEGTPANTELIVVQVPIT